ncbi:MAG UNVERIFIED_CONTAM: hypothetical protein LVR29_29225 [Microcystis novacekii LVE1205-3]
MIVLFPKKLVRFYRKKFGDKIIFKSLLVGLGVSIQEIIFMVLRFVLCNGRGYKE